MNNIRHCWCGNTDFLPFGSEYGECRDCGTLVYLKDIPPDQLIVRDDESDFYGKKYWLEHQQDAFGYTDIYNRARNDLTERNLHWLKALLKYRLPPAEVLEVGCAHGSFVALMQQAGYEASGVELSPWVVSYGRETFGVPIHIGPVESLNWPLASLDVIVLMDVLEHLPDPMATMRRCLELLKPDGLLLIQTPQFKEELSYGALVESKDRFLEMLIPDEHIYLFSERSVTDFFGRLGAKHIYFEPAIFAHYDMSFAVSRVPLKTHTLDEIESALLATSNGRFALALLDLRERELALTQRWMQSEADRTVQGGQITELTALVAERETQLTALDRQVRELNAMLQESEADRTARSEQITELTVLAAERETQLAALDHQVRELNILIQESEADRADRYDQIVKLTDWLNEANADRQACSQQIQDLTLMMQDREQQLAISSNRYGVFQREMQAFKAAAQALKTETGLVRRLKTVKTADKGRIEHQLLPVHLVSPPADPALPVLFHLDVFDYSDQICHLAGWAFCPWFDASQTTLQVLLEAENGCHFVVTLPKRQRPDVAAHFANVDFSKHLGEKSLLSPVVRKHRFWFRRQEQSMEKSPRLVLPPDRPVRLDWSGFDGSFLHTSLPMGLITLHIRVIEGSCCAGTVMKTAVAFPKN